MLPYKLLKPLERDLCDWVRSTQTESNWVPAGIYRRYGAGVMSETAPAERQAKVLPRANAEKVYATFDRYLESVRSDMLAAWRLQAQAVTWEGTQLVRYEAGGFFVPHRDATDLFAERIITLVAYLNDDFSGGETAFPTFDVEVAPKTGMVITFPSETIHAAKSVTIGEKFAFLSWATVRQQRWI